MFVEDSELKIGGEREFALSMKLNNRRQFVNL